MVHCFSYSTTSHSLCKRIIEAGDLELPDQVHGRSHRRTPQTGKVTATRRVDVKASPQCLRCPRQTPSQTRWEDKPFNGSRQTLLKTAGAPTRGRPYSPSPDPHHYARGLPPTRPPVPPRKHSPAHAPTLVSTAAASGPSILMHHSRHTIRIPGGFTERSRGGESVCRRG